MSYSRFDFEESLKQAEGFSRDDVAECAAAWGGSPEGGGSWEGGFLLRLKDGRWAYLTGWCDYTGWGCQDGASTTLFDARPPLTDLEKELREYEDGQAAWDELPGDLNRWLNGLTSGLDE